MNISVYRVIKERLVINSNKKSIIILFLNHFYITTFLVLITLKNDGGGGIIDFPIKLDYDDAFCKRLSQLKNQLLSSC